MLIRLFTILGLLVFLWGCQESKAGVNDNTKKIMVDAEYSYDGVEGAVLENELTNSGQFGENTGLGEMAETSGGYEQAVEDDINAQEGAL